MPGDKATALTSRKRKALDSAEDDADVQDSTDTTAQGPFILKDYLLDGDTMKSHNDEAVPKPPMPKNATFWAMFEWHFMLLKIAFGPSGSQKWAE